MERKPFSEPFSLSKRASEPVGGGRCIWSMMGCSSFFRDATLLPLCLWPHQQPPEQHQHPVAVPDWAGLLSTGLCGRSCSSLSEVSGPYMGQWPSKGVGCPVWSPALPGGTVQKHQGLQWDTSSCCLVPHRQRNFALSLLFTTGPWGILTVRRKHCNPGSPRLAGLWLADPLARS